MITVNNTLLKKDKVNVNMECQISLATSQWEAQRIKAFFEKRGIPCSIRQDDFFNKLAVYTDKDNFPRAMDIYENSCRLKDIFTGEIIREALWNF